MSASGDGRPAYWRFNRARCDAARTIAAFSTRLRQQVDLTTLTAELVAVVDRTMQPTRASFWLRSNQGPTADHPARDDQPTGERGAGQR